MRSLIVYWTATGNTAKVAQSIHQALTTHSTTVDTVTVAEAQDIDWLDYDLVCLGFPSHGWQPPEAVREYLSNRFAVYRKRGLVRAGAPRRRGKQAIIFCTYSGPHTGLAEAIPAGKYAAQFFDHLGFRILDEIYVVGEFHGREDLNTKGRLGDIRGRPDTADLAHVARRVSRLVTRSARDA